MYTTPGEPWHQCTSRSRSSPMQGGRNEILDNNRNVEKRCCLKRLLKPGTGEPLYLHEVVVDAGQAVGGADVLLLVPLVHQRAVVLDPELPAQWDPVLPQLLVDEDEGVEETHPAIEQLIGQPACTLHHVLVKLQQSGEQQRTRALAMVDHCSYREGPCVPAQEGDVMTSGQTLQAAVDVFQSSLEQGVVPEHVVEVQSNSACVDAGLPS
ncbi:hypothetical protein EYF80_043519 [Liparis tanakae]|uniref:Uncharacterized protein n=1 Tax=Liparis tanakae TaxID=230148 RepID=A0A4Z2FZ73_9TELE|nr:hypothetical protein EYF80_043519 [Liparis tanakae]